MEKYRFRSTIYLVFLLVSLLVNGLLLYMLIDYPGYVECKSADSIDFNLLTEDANSIYKRAYGVINGDNFYMPSEVTSQGDEKTTCYLVNISLLEDYFTPDLLNKFANNLEIIDNKMYDCNEDIFRKLFVSLFGITDQGIRELKYISGSDDIFLFSGKLPQNEFIAGDKSPLYIVFKKVNGKLLIDHFE